MSFTDLDDLLEISDVYAFCLHDLHNDAVHVTEVRVAVARSAWRRARGGDVATRTTHTAIARTWNTGHTVVLTGGARDTWVSIATPCYTPSIVGSTYIWYTRRFERWLYSCLHAIGGQTNTFPPIFLFLSGNGRVRTRDFSNAGLVH
jgi:hypothetical protein